LFRPPIAEQVLIAMYCRSFLGLKSAEKKRVASIVNEPLESLVTTDGDTSSLVPPRVSVVIPARNEARNLPSVLASLPPDLFEVILVDGHSGDNTVDVARRCRPDIRVVCQGGHGKGNALACGFAAARGDVIVTLDGDGSTKPEEIPRFVAALRYGADFAKGSRFTPGGGSADITAMRKAGNFALVCLVNLLFRTRYTDLCYGFNAFWTRCLPKLEVDSDGFEVETLLNIKAARSGLKVAEVPSFERGRLHGLSNLRAWPDGMRVLRTVLSEYLSPRSYQAVQWSELDRQPVTEGFPDRAIATTGGEARGAAWTSRLAPSSAI
jgi:glycosyltransferase involved in cell wall biosynthesis